MNQEDFTTEEGKGKHLCLWERKEIEKAVKRGAGIRETAKALNRSASTISREIKRGSVEQRRKINSTSKKKEVPLEIVEKRYFAETGQVKAEKNKGLRGGKYKLFEDPELIKYIEDKILKDKWSPATVTGWLGNSEHNFKTTICFKTIYNYIDRGLLAVKNIDLLLKMRLKVKKKRIRQYKRKLGNSIELRPKAIDSREEFGHWEGDSVVGKENKSAILTLVERKTNKGFILSLKDKGAESVNEALTMLFNEAGRSLFKTITFDNGSEFADSHKLENEQLQIYFAHPYSAYERGINENYNGIIRRFIPKGIDLSKYNQSDLNRINNMIDSLPRKRHSYKTAEMMFNFELKKNFSNLG